MIYTKTGGLEVIQEETIKSPVFHEDQVLVEVKACALNISDYQRFQTKNGKSETFNMQKIIVIM